MAKLPVYQASPAFQGGGPQLRPTPGGIEAGAQIGKAVRRFGQAVGGVEDAITTLNNQNDVANVTQVMAEARSAWTDYLHQAATAAKPGDNFSEDYQTKLNQYLADAQPIAQTRAGRDAFNRMAVQMRYDLSTRADAMQADLAGTAAKNSYLSSLNSWRNALTNDPTQFDSTLKDAEASLSDPNGPYGKLDPAVRDTLAKQTKEGLALAAVQGIIENDPIHAQHVLVTGAFDKYLSADAKPVLIRAADEAIRTQAANQLWAQKQAEHAQLQLQQATAKDGYTLQSEGKLTPQWVKDNRDNLSESDFHYFLKASTGAAGITDPHVYATLRIEAGQGRDVRPEAKRALYAGQLTVDNFNAIVGEVESNAVSAQTPSWYKLGKQYISTALRTSQVNPNPAAQQIEARTLDDWSAWSRAHPNATYQEAERTYRRMAQNSALVNFNEISVAIPKPIYLVGSRQAPDLQATWQRTKEAYQRGDIDQWEYKRQAGIINDLRQAYEAAQQRHTTDQGVH